MCLIILYIHAIVILVTWRGVVWLSWLQRMLELYGYQQENKWQISFTRSHLKLTLCVDHVIALVVLGLYKYCDIIYRLKRFQGHWPASSAKVSAAQRWHFVMHFAMRLLVYNNSNNYFFIGIQWKLDYYH